MAKGKFAQQAEVVVMDLGQLFNRSIRAALVAGLTAAVRATGHDSSNAAAHWMIAAEDGSKSRPWQRKTGKLNDFRGTRGSRGEPARAPVAPVGYRRDRGKNASRTLKFVRERELREVVNKMVKGHTPEGRFYFYHPLAAGLVADQESEVDVEKYAERAKIESAGTSAVEATAQAFQRHFLAGNVRRGRK